MSDYEEGGFDSISVKFCFESLYAVVLLLLVDRFFLFIAMGLNFF